MPCNDQLILLVLNVHHVAVLLHRAWLQHKVHERLPIIRTSTILYAENLDFFVYVERYFPELLKRRCHNVTSTVQEFLSFYD